MNVSVFGAGYVGLTVAACLSQLGHKVLVFDKDHEKINNLNLSEISIYEPGLQELIRMNVIEGRLQFTNQNTQAIEASEVLIIAVGTPLNSDGSADTSCVMDVANMISEHINESKTILVKSTVPVGVCRNIQNLLDNKINSRSLNFEVQVISNPEFLREGQAIHDFMYPDRIVVGFEKKNTQSMIKNLYGEILNRTHLVETDLETSELCKYASNAFLATKISFMNELSRLCEKTRADIDKVRESLGYDKRIGSEFLNAGIGFGGSCLPKDLSSIIHLADTVGEKLSILEAVKLTNLLQRERFVQMITSKMSPLNLKSITVWGLSFKANTDDLRDSPAVFIVEDLAKSGFKINAFDPMSFQVASKYFKNNENVTVSQSLFDSLSNSEALCILTDWDQFKNVNLLEMKKYLRHPIIFDGRNIFRPETVQGHGFEYYSIGRG
jgi:UDPglucose 6-dehydrogenase